MTLPLLTVLRLSDTCGGRVHAKRTADAAPYRCVRRLRRAQWPIRPGMVPGPLRTGAMLKYVHAFIDRHSQGGKDVYRR
jgi:hypothetical protein